MHEIFEISGPLDLTVLMKVYGLPGFDAPQGTRLYAPAGAGPDE